MKCQELKWIVLFSPATLRIQTSGYPHTGEGPKAQFVQMVAGIFSPEKILSAVTLDDPLAWAPHGVAAVVQQAVATPMQVWMQDTDTVLGDCLRWGSHCGVHR